MEPSTVINLQEPLDMSKLRKRMIKKAEKELVQISEESSKSSYDEFIKLQNDAFKITRKFKTMGAVFMTMFFMLSGFSLFVNWGGYFVIRA